MKREYDEDLLSWRSRDFRGFLIPSDLISDLNSFEILNLAKKVSDWNNNWISNEKNNYRNSPESFVGTLDKENAPEVFTDDLAKKLNFTNIKELRFILDKKTSKKLFKRDREDYLLNMYYACGGYSRHIKGNLIKELYFDVQKKL